MTIREAWEKKKADQAASQAAARSGETVAPKGRQPGKLKKLFSKTGMAIAATTMLTAAVAATTGQGSGCPSGTYPCTYTMDGNGDNEFGPSATTCCKSGMYCSDYTGQIVVKGKRVLIPVPLCLPAQPPPA